MKSSALNTFRSRMANPLHWRKANRILVRYTQDDLQNLDRTKHLISTLASEFDVPLTPRETEDAAKWLVAREIDPQSKKDRLRVWKMTK